MSVRDLRFLVGDLRVKPAKIFIAISFPMTSDILKSPEPREGSSSASFELPRKGIGIFIIGPCCGCCGTNAKGFLTDFAVEAEL